MPLSNERLIPAREVWRRYSITSRTLSRWLERSELHFPKPLIVNGRRYWWLGEIEAWERLRASDPKAALSVSECSVPTNELKLLKMLCLRRANKRSDAVSAGFLNVPSELPNSAASFALLLPMGGRALRAAPPS
jgi:hypothetical protein